MRRNRGNGVSFSAFVGRKFIVGLALPPLSKFQFASDVYVAVSVHETHEF